jgi:hypothetical protein
MYLLRYDPVTTEVKLENVADPQVLANFTQLYVTYDLQLTTGTVLIDEFIFIEDGISMTLENGAVLELA